MKVIELLAKIANGEETHFDTKLNDKSVSVRYYNDRNFSSSTDPEMLTIADIIKSLNDEVEIIEEQKEDKKIEKLETYDITGNVFLEDCCFKYIPIDKERLTANEQVFVNKINEIMDYINGGTNGE